MKHARMDLYAEALAILRDLRLPLVEHQMRQTARVMALLAERERVEGRNDGIAWARRVLLAEMGHTGP